MRERLLELIRAVKETAHAAVTPRRGLQLAFNVAGQPDRMRSGKLTVGFWNGHEMQPLDSTVTYSNTSPATITGLGTGAPAPKIEVLESGVPGVKTITNRGARRVEIALVGGGGMGPSVVSIEAGHTMYINKPVGG